MHKIVVKKKVETNYYIYFWLKGLTRLWRTLTCEQVKSVNVFIYAVNGHLFLLFHYLNALRKELLVFLVSVFLLLLVRTEWLNGLNGRSFPPKEMCFLCLWPDGWFTQTICDLSDEPPTRSVNKNPLYRDVKAETITSAAKLGRITWQDQTFHLCWAAFSISNERTSIIRPWSSIRQQLN